MTTRDQARRRGLDRTEASRPPVAVEAVPSLPERLLAAREHKGVDLYRAERDTKIRARYLGALERGDYRELPGAVYTKGFLRNYALYLGLDPEDILAQWHRERGDAGPQEPVIVPRVLEAPRRGLTFTPGILVAVLLTVVLALFGGYMALQLSRYEKPPSIAVNDPKTAVWQVDEATTTYTLRGTSNAGATVTISASGRDPYRVTAKADGTWSVEVDLRRGENRFEVTAVDPETGKGTEETARVFINRPFAVFQVPTLAIDQPPEGATFENGAIPIEGTATNAKTVTVGARYEGPVNPAVPAASPAPDATPVPTPVPPTAPAAQTVPVAADGTFSAPFELTAGRWTLTVTATSAEGRAVSLSRAVTVTYKGVNLVVALKGGRAWLRVVVDGVVDPGIGDAGRVFADGKVLTFIGQQSIEVRTGVSSVTYFTLNGSNLGRLSDRANPETWLFAPPDPPKRTR